MRYAVVIERGPSNYSAYVPDLPGCVSVGETLAEVKAEIREAVAFHLEGMREDGVMIPAPSSRTTYVELPKRPEGRRAGPKIIRPGATPLKKRAGK